MLKTTSILAVTAAFALAACASSGSTSDAMAEKAAAKLAQFEKTGSTESCVPLRQIKSIDPLNSELFLVKMRGNKTYLNEVSGNCSGAGRAGNAITYRTSQSSLCNNEIIRVFDRNADVTVGSCSLGKFQELTKKSAE